MIVSSHIVCLCQPTFHFPTVHTLPSPHISIAQLWRPYSSIVTPYTTVIQLINQYFTTSCIKRLLIVKNIHISQCFCQADRTNAFAKLATVSYGGMNWRLSSLHCEPVGIFCVLNNSLRASRKSCDWSPENNLRAETKWQKIVTQCAVYCHLVFYRKYAQFP